jgi:glycosyltransferase involved in cell wall biosynthesis
MARLAVVTSHPPFTEGGHLVIARNLVSTLREAGHEADLVLTPQNRFGRQAAAYLATWLTDVGESDGRRVDQVISLRFPSFAVRHQRHVCWLNHTMREYYDLWPSFRARISWKGRIKEGVRRRLIHRADRWLLSPRRLTRLFVQSRTVQERVRQTIGLEGEILYPPPPIRPYRCDGYGSYVFTVSRLVPHKRIDLLIRALAEPEGAGIRLVVAGDGEARDELRSLAGALGVLGRVTLLGPVDQDVLLTHFARCRAVAFTPLGEDYGFVTSEAFASGKAVVACTDSGGPVELVEHETTGLIVKPTPAALAGALRRVTDEPGLAERMGTAALRRVAEMSWPTALAKLVVV